jgi:hypothetical protein
LKVNSKKKFNGIRTEKKKRLKKLKKNWISQTFIKKLLPETKKGSGNQKVDKRIHTGTCR